MLKAYSNQGIILGLSAENIRRLKSGKPIKFNLTELNGHPDAPILPDVNVIILAGDTEKNMANTLLKLAGEKRRI